MKAFFFLLVLITASLSVTACYLKPEQKKLLKDTSKISDSSKQTYIVEVGCGQCRFGMKGKSCDLAVRIKGKIYFVDGTSIDGHGDAHAKDGFCNSIRRAKVQGSIVNDRFSASYFEVLREARKKL